ncbi:hypothetical protein ACS0TY_013663 [Phlomoides rotata]
MTRNWVYNDSILTYVASRNSRICGVNHSGSLQCWQWREFNSNGTGNISSSLAVGGDFVCGLSELRENQCFAIARNVLDYLPQRSFTQVEAGFRHACGVSSNGSLECWGDRAGETPQGFRVVELVYYQQMRKKIKAEAEMVVVLIAMFLLGSSIELANCKYMVYNTSQGIVPDKLNVHLVPHTHDDVGWLKTVDQYYVGSNNSIQGTCVQTVLDSLIPALIADKNRKFIYVEHFSSAGGGDQSDTIQQIVRQLVSSGQLEFM